MFKFKQCKSCGIKNKKYHEHCTKCGDTLDDVIRTSTKSIVIILILFLLLGSTATTFAYFKYYKKPITKSEQPSEQNDATKQKMPYTCPSGTESPNGGDINWDGSENCVPKATPSATTTPTPTKTTTNSTSNNNTSTNTTLTPAPVSSPDPKICENQKAVQVASIDTIYNGKINTENTQHQANLNRIGQDYTNRGLFGSGSYIQAIDAENSAHQVRVNDIDAWYNLELIKIDQSC